jgi:hypothetical protein
MSTPANRSEYLLLFRNTQLEKRLSREEMEEAMQRLNEWLGRWSERGQMKSGHPLDNEAKVISGARQRTVADGPFAESKEAVGGYVIVLATDLDEAVAIAKEWPLLDYDATVEVRPLRKQCATMEQIGQQLVELGT